MNLRKEGGERKRRGRSLNGGKIRVCVHVCVCVFELPAPAAEPHQSGLLAAEQTGQSYVLAGVPLSSSPQPFTVTQGSK